MIYVYRGGRGAEILCNFGSFGMESERKLENAWAANVVG